MSDKPPDRNRYIFDNWYIREPCDRFKSYDEWDLVSKYPRLLKLQKGPVFLTARNIKLRIAFLSWENTPCNIKLKSLFIFTPIGVTFFIV